MPAPEQHAVLSASSSYRWLNCPPSARLAEQFPESTSQYAEAGLVAHAIAELKARKYFVEPMSARAYNSRLKKLKEDPHYDNGMDAATDAYLDHLKSLSMSFGDTPPFVALETRVPFDDYVPQGFGTADCIMIGAGGMCVCDYKNGAGVAVEAERNSQMMLYALGALKLYAPIYGETIQEIHLSIIQPNAGGVKEWGLSRSELEEWGETEVKPTAALSWEGKGAFCPGPWCDKGFCPAKASCTARAKKMLELEPLKGSRPAGAVIGGEPLEPGAPLLSDAEVGDALTRALDLESWVKDLKDYALTAALDGRTIAGFKVVEGRGSRDWTDLNAAFESLAERGVEEALLWERKPVTVAGLEKALGKKTFEETASSLWAKKPGKPALVPASDPRPPYTRASMAFEAVSGDG